MDHIFPFITMFAVANSALINMLMASRLLYGMANQDVLPRVARRGACQGRRTPWVSIIFTTLIAFGLIIAVTKCMDEDSIALARWHHRPAAARRVHVVNIAVLVLRRTRSTTSTSCADRAADPRRAVCAFLVGPWTGRDAEQYAVAAGCSGSASCSGS